VATGYKGSRGVQVPPGHNPIGLDMIHDPKAKNGGTTPRQILDIQLFRQSLLISDEFEHGTSFIRKSISLPFQKSLRMPQLDVVCNLGISFNMDSSWTSCTLDIEIVLAILVESNFIWMWDQCHWKVYVVLFRCI
jgi:hypothetical protein